MSHKVREALASKNWSFKRLLNAFPDLTFLNMKQLKKMIKKQAKFLKEKTKKLARLRKKEERLKNKQKEIEDEIKNKIIPKRYCFFYTSFANTFIL